MLQVSLDNGTVQGFDVRAASSNSTSDSKPTFTLHAHDAAVTSVSYNSSAPNVCSRCPHVCKTDELLLYKGVTNVLIAMFSVQLLATGSLDKMVK